MKKREKDSCEELDAFAWKAEDFRSLKVLQRVLVINIWHSLCKNGMSLFALKPSVGHPRILRSETLQQLATPTWMGMSDENEPVLIVDGLADLGVPALRQHVQDRRHRPQRLQPGLAI
jgi:hypothetical protein